MPGGQARIGPEESVSMAASLSFCQFESVLALGVQTESSGTHAVKQAKV
jgi:hypothetical protein